MKIISLFSIVGATLFATANTHQVTRGDTLWKISQQYKTSVSTIQSLNSLSSNTIHIGQVLKLPSVESDQKAKAGKFQKEFALQTALDRLGYGPGVIDGAAGHFTHTAYELCPKDLLTQEVCKPSSKVVVFQVRWHDFVNMDLPTVSATGHPDFQTLTAEKEILLYTSIEELIAERFHCTTKLLAKLNPEIDLATLTDGEPFSVPNVTAFEVEAYFNEQSGAGQWTGLFGMGKEGRSIVVEKKRELLTLWEEGRIVRSFPITVNQADTPLGERTIEQIAPAPLYSRQKTQLDLMAGPNSPVGIMWCRLGDGYGIHGTNNPDRIGRNTSSGCIRLANWDVVRLAGMIRNGVPVKIVDQLPSYEASEMAQH